MKSLRQRKKDIQKHQDKQHQEHLHLVAGQHNHRHSVTHSVAPISADEVERLNNIDPLLVNRIFSIMETSLEIENSEQKKFYEAIQREQENDQLSITSKHNSENKAIKYAMFTMVFLILSGAGFVYFGYDWIGGGLITTVMLGIIQSILKREHKKED